MNLQTFNDSKASYPVISDCFIHGAMDGDFNRIGEKGQPVCLRQRASYLMTSNVYRRRPVRHYVVHQFVFE